MNIHWEYMLSTYTKFIMKDTCLEYLQGIHTLFVNDIIIFQMLHENTTTLDQGDFMFTTLPRFTECLRG